VLFTVQDGVYQFSICLHYRVSFLKRFLLLRANKSQKCDKKIIFHK